MCLHYIRMPDARPGSFRSVVGHAGDGRDHDHAIAVIGYRQTFLAATDTPQGSPDCFVFHFHDPMLVATPAGLRETTSDTLVAHAPRFYWRSRADNPVNEFYYAVCDGAVKSGRWTVFWRGEGDLSRIAGRVARIAGLPPTLEEAAS